MYFVASLLEMSDWGGTDTESLKKGIDNIFMDDGNMPVAQYQTKLLSLTTNGCLMTRFAANREWLVKIHCISHLVELTVKAALKESKFKDTDDFYSSNFYLLRDYGKIKLELKIACEALGTQHCSLPKMSGTRFVGHRRRAFRTLLDMWPTFTMVYSNVVSNNKARSETKAKIEGLLRKSENYRYISLTCLYLDLLERTVHASKVFEGEKLLSFEIKMSIQTTLANLTELLDDDYDDLDSHLQRFWPSENEEGELILESEYNNPMGKSRKIENWKSVKIPFLGITSLGEQTENEGRVVRKNTLGELIKILKERFKSFDENIFSLMNWFHSQNWTDQKDFGIDDLNKFDHFSSPLTAARYDNKKVILEWRSLSHNVNISLSKKEPRILWKTIMNYKRNEYPNKCLLAELMITLSGSNSEVERGFSILTMMLFDRRLKTSLDLMNYHLTIKINDKNWSEAEKSEILQRALQIYLS